jgi:hypothetical protein
MENLFAGNHVVLVLSSEKNFSETTRVVASQFSSVKKLCVFALAKPPISLEQDLVRAGIPREKLHFIDAVSGCKGMKSCEEVVSLEDLASLNIAYTNALTNGCNGALVPAVTVLFSYANPPDMLQFISSLASKTRSHNANLAFVTLWHEHDQGALREAFLFMDKVVDLRTAK